MRKRKVAPETSSAADAAEEAAGRYDESPRAEAAELGRVRLTTAQTGPAQLEMAIGAPDMTAEPHFADSQSFASNAALGASKESPQGNRHAGAAISRAAARSSAEPRSRRFLLLATTLALAASIGALGGSLALGAIGRFFPPAPAAPLAAHAHADDEIRLLKETIAQLRGNMKVLSDHVAAVRSGLTASTSSATAQLAKLIEAIEKLERVQGERRGQSAAAPETTGSTAPAAEAKPAVVEGWVLRKAARDAALVEGRYGVIEIEPGDHLPGVGRIEQIKRQDGRWVVVTAKGLIVPAR
jgi:hypothetical protein